MRIILFFFLKKNVIYRYEFSSYNSDCECVYIIMMKAILEWNFRNMEIIKVQRENGLIGDDEKRDL